MTRLQLRRFGKPASSESEGNSSRMAENLKIASAYDADESDPAGLSRSYRKCGRRRNCDDQARTDHGGFLHHLDRDTAREDDGTAATRNPRRGERASELVERVVAADVLAHDH